MSHFLLKTGDPPIEYLILTQPQHVLSLDTHSASTLTSTMKVLDYVAKGWTVWTNAVATSGTVHMASAWKGT